MLKAHSSLGRSPLLGQKAHWRPVFPHVVLPGKPASALRSLGSSRGNGSSRDWDFPIDNHQDNQNFDGSSSAEELWLNGGTGDQFFSSSNSSSSSGGSGGGDARNEAGADRERREPSGSGAGEHSTRGSGSSRDWVMADSNSKSSGRDWDQSWKDWVWQNSSNRAPELPSRGAGSSRGGVPATDSFMTSTGVSWAPSSGYNINSYNRMNEERLEGLQWLSRYLAGKRQKGWLWNNEAKAFAELRRRGIECCAHHGGKHLYFVPGHSDQLSAGGVFRILFHEVDALRESNARDAREDKRIADDLRAAIKAKIQPEAGLSDLDDATPPTPPPLRSAQDQAPGTSHPTLPSECNDSPQECLNDFLFGNGQETQ